jgi:translation initiation factor 1
LNRLVYSTRDGKICPGCEKPVAACVCPKGKKGASGHTQTARRGAAPGNTPASNPPADGIVRVRREVKGRGGKTVSVVMGLPLDGDALEALGTELKRRCGTGGTVKDGAILIQGDHVDLLIAELERRGHCVKRAGG